MLPLASRRIIIPLQLIPIWIQGWRLEVAKKLINRIIAQSTWENQEHVLNIVFEYVLQMKVFFSLTKSFMNKQ